MCTRVMVFIVMTMRMMVMSVVILGMAERIVEHVLKQHERIREAEHRRSSTTAEEWIVAERPIVRSAETTTWTRCVERASLGRRPDAVRVVETSILRVPEHLVRIVHLPNRREIGVADAMTSRIIMRTNLNCSSALVLSSGDAPAGSLSGCVSSALRLYAFFTCSAVALLSSPRIS
jgi:hypothetical protein